MNAKKIKTAPHICRYSSDDDDTLIIEIALPGVKRKDIELRLNENSMYVSAPMGDIHYVTSESLCCPIVPGKAHARLKNGLLKIEAPYRDTVKGAMRITIS
ncbi:MAG TPA: CS domain-containing protein [Chitinivibrionales bacterium]|nr:CS domain-containing protein [Chitinivibrionales bacterium]